MTSLCKKLESYPDHGLAFYVLGHVLSDIAGAWEERAVSVEEAEFAQKRLLVPFRQLVAYLQEGRIAPDKLMNKLDSIVRVSFETIPVLKAHKYI